MARRPSDTSIRQRIRDLLEFIGRKLQDIQTEQRLQRMRFDTLEVRFSSFDSRFGAIEERMASIENKLDAIIGKLEA